MKYDIIVLGAGSGGLNIAVFMNRAGFKVLLVDRSDRSIGGDCLNYGCVPSKSLIHIAKIIHDAGKAERFGLKAKGRINMKKVADYINQRKGIIRKHENAHYFRKQGIDVELGAAKFVSRNSITVNGKNYSAKKIVIATGSKPRMLDIPGMNRLNKADIITNEQVFDLNKLPEKLLIIGGGPIGIEIGQALLRLGSEVNVVEFMPNFLPRELPEISEILFNQLKKEGMKFYFDSSVEEFKSNNEAIIKDKKGRKTKVEFNKVLMAVGRIPNIDLDLEKAGIKVKEGKIVSDEYLRTTNRNIFVCGDAVGSYQFTHAAELHAKIILRNFFSPFKRKISYDDLPWVTFTYPEIASFGLDIEELKRRKIRYEKLSYDFRDDDRSIVDDFRDGRMVLYVHKEKLYGGTIIAPIAGEICQELILAKYANIKLKKIFEKTYAYPTAGRVNRNILTGHYARKLTPFVKRLFKILY